MSLSRKIRFEVFKRDAFRCCYCGKNPPQVTLEVDHINPVSAGGTDEISNLLSACFDCNRGKKNIPLTKIPNQLHENLQILQEKEDQLRQYNACVRKIRRREDGQIKQLGDIYTGHFPEYQFTESFNERSLRPFLRQLPFETIEENLTKACLRIRHDQHAIKYFCGICWKMIRPDDRKDE